jgi:hypothetical protein
MEAVELESTDQNVARKCPRKVHEWKRSIRKNKRNQGEEYTNDTTKKNYPKKTRGMYG